ncbi:MAG: M20/M25/M40 family metallo-hydrolase [Firmicutes bacterium]|nr:M20/M25/M40 family metallo-hydrolase [Bacillota bacterium]HXL03448.1 M20/M25/M40 family metallo-hydrolase [Bacillota bacterium]
MGIADLRHDFLELVRIPGPSGFEQPVADAIRNKIQSLVSTVETDGMGNLLATKEGPEGAPILALMAHMDEISMVTTDVRDGFVWFDFVVDINSAVTAGQPVVILTGKGPVPGVVRSPSTHLGQSLNSLWIDAGPRCAQVEPGDPIVFDTIPRWLDDEETLLASRAVDNRQGCAILLETARQLAEVELDVSVVFAFTVQEEVGCRGARHLAKTVYPKWAISIDTGYGADPEAGPGVGVPPDTGPVIRRFESVKPGRGMLMFFADRELVAGLRESADAAGIPYSLDVRFGLFTDAAGVYDEWSDIKCVSITVPRRYSHSPYEVINLNTMGQASELLTVFLRNLKAGN